MRGIFDGFVKWIFLLLALGAGFVFVLKTFLNPPKASAPISSNPSTTQPLSPPTQTNKPVNPSNPVQSDKSPQSNNSPVSNSSQSQPSTTNLAPEPELVSSSTSDKNDIPTTEQPEEYILEIPTKLESGAELKIFVNNDDAVNPNPANYSPSKIIKTQNIVLSPQKTEGMFQESSGYFKVEETGEYNFLIGFDNNDKRYLDDGELVGKVDQEPLGNPKGGRVELDQGWHRLDLFYNPQIYARRIDEKAIIVKMGRPGKVAKTIEIWRAVDDQNSTQKETKNSAGSN